MRTIKLAKPWSFHTIARTIDYPAGEHEVTNEVADAADADGVDTAEKADGKADGAAKADAKGAADKSKG